MPAALLQDKTKDISRDAAGWLGEVRGFKAKCAWIDAMLLLVFGGIPWQVNIIEINLK